MSKFVRNESIYRVQINSKKSWAPIFVAVAQREECNGPISAQQNIFPFFWFCNGQKRGKLRHETTSFHATIGQKNWVMAAREALAHEHVAVAPQATR